MDLNHVKKLREDTGLSVMECKKAIEAAGGDFKKAMEILKEKERVLADKKTGAETHEGLVEAYIHSNGKIGVLVELCCQTDFVARNDDFKKLTRDIAMQIAACDPGDSDALMAQPFIKDISKTVGELLQESIARTGENIKVGRFSRFKI
ncbi:translation elongation factor Ts [Candidatus Falkowbacteria bacterium]|nr:translation elongation factor Ts [Candidatus Falkowbacteria bacterium]